MREETLPHLVIKFPPSHQPTFGCHGEFLGVAVLSTPSDAQWKMLLLSQPRVRLRDFLSFNTTS